ncbi:hypothetical protein LCL89_15600 [Halobacillus yeomjeoni]|uniref:Uncharacterized protein n=1 Tax=Halobacillus yeomjeoni TaxID=311194 RepID=A0A931HWC9_9BACI|nr:hypothetical protein [Halobacillus yeomjeoni]MBH0230575.1 hypothetical protein [Halobacillus yeomjeoni]MCA0985460.1 hypothetical protein [Halobacillus yeomjeoni]
MTYHIVGVDERHIVIEFRKDKKELVFHDYQSAKEYLDKIQRDGVIPSQYKLQIREK